MAIVETDADRRFRRLAAAIAGSADPHVPVLDLDVGGRTFTYRVGRDSGRPRTRRVTVLEHVLELSDGIGDIASHAWGEELSDEDGWFRFTLSNWDESSITDTTSEDGWWTFGAGRGIAPVPPWQVADYAPTSDELFLPDESIDHQPNRRKPRRRR